MHGCCLLYSIRYSTWQSIIYAKTVTCSYLFFFLLFVGIPAAADDKFGLDRWFESNKIHAAALVVSNCSDIYSHWSAVKSLDAWLKESNIPAIAGLEFIILFCWLSFVCSRNFYDFQLCSTYAIWQSSSVDKFVIYRNRHSSFNKENTGKWNDAGKGDDFRVSYSFAKQSDIFAV